MLGKRLLKVMGGLAIMATAMPAMAFDSSAFMFDMSAPNGWYLEGNAGTAHLSNADYPGSTSNSGWSYNANLGYKFMPYLGIEIGYSRYADSKISVSGTNVATVTHNSYDVAARGILPICSTGFELFAKVGVQRISAKASINDSALASSANVGSTSHSDVNALIGAGAQLYVLPELAIVAQWQRAQGDSQTGTEDLYTIGLSFIFV